MFCFAVRGHSMKSARDDRRVHWEGWQPNGPRTFSYVDDLFTNIRLAGSDYSVVEIGRFRDNSHGAFVVFLWI